MKEEKAACNCPEADPLFRKLPWIKNLTDSYAEIFLLGSATEWRFQGNSVLKYVQDLLNNLV